jgi:two-component system, LuxR family, sensor kinase FixL
MRERKNMRRKEAIGALLVCIGYYLGASVGFALTLHPHPVSTLWPPNAILLAALLLMPVRSWWLVLLSAFPAHLAVQLQGGVPLPMTLCWFVSNSSEALIGAAGVRFFMKDSLELDSFFRVGIFVVFAGFLAPFLSSFLDAGFVVLNDWGAGGYWDIWRRRLFANILANLTLVPVIVTAATRGISSLRRVSVPRLIETALFVGVLVAVCTVVFVARNTGPGTSPALLYFPLPLLLWAAMRWGPGGTSAAMLVFALLAIWGASRGQGPFLASSPAENALSIQLFLIVISVPLMALAAVMEERGKAQETARRSEEKLNLALNAVQLGTWDWDIPANSAELSDGSRRMFGLADSVAGVSLEQFYELVHRDDLASLRRAVSRSVALRADLEIEFRVIHPDGTHRWVLSKGKLLCDEAGEPIRMIGVSVDITDRKRADFDAEEHRREVAHLGRVVLVGELSGALAHELNQPLAAILANARAGQRFLAHDPPDIGQLHEILGAIVDDDLRAGDVITRLRALLKKDETRQEPIVVNSVVREVLGIAHGDLIAREVSVTTDLATDLQRVLGDRVQLQQVLLNLILNACDAMSAMPAGLRRLTIVTSRDVDGVRIVVSDRGTGIPSDRIESIFEPFVTSKTHGLGLGLAICRSIVSAHDGRLWAENNPESGATFHVTLPAAVQSQTVESFAIERAIP